MKATRLVALLCILLCIGSKQTGPTDRDIDSGIFTRLAGPLKTAQSLFSITEKKFSNFLLVDSVVSIFTAYFVDERVGSEQVMLAKLIEVLNSYNDVSARSALKNIWIEVRGKKTKIPLPKNYSVTRVSNILIKAASFVEKHAPEIFERTKKQYAKHNGAVVKVLNDTLASMDQHSVVLSKELYRELIEGTEGSFGGLGIVVGIQNSILTVIKTLADSPASVASLAAGDRILSIDGFETYGLKLDDLIQKMRGPPDSLVEVKVLGNRDLKPKIIRMKRKKIDVASTELSLEKISKGRYLAKIYLEHFSTRTSEDVERNLDFAQRKLGDKLAGIILDLRGNPGGLLDQSVLVADLFLGKGNIVITKGRNDEEIEFASNYQRFPELPIFVLLNHDSASASEILAGALQDHDRAVVIGQRSFGKGSVQTIFELPGGMAMKVTIAKYFTPGKKQIQGQGIVPDIWAEFARAAGKKVTLNGQRLKLGRSFFRQEKSEYPSYYLQEGGKEKDFELVTVQKLMNTKFSTSKKPFSAKTFLSHSRGITKQYVDSSTKQTSDLMAKNLGVDWKKPQQKNQAYKPALAIDLPKIYSSPGKWISIPYTLSNKGQVSGSRVSVYAYEQGKVFSAKERLVGQHNVGKKIQGSFDMRIPGDFARSTMKLKIGVASDIDPVRQVEQDVTVHVVSTKEPSIDYSYKLVSENKTKDNSLELGEKAALEISFKNNGATPVENISFGLTNLSGLQVASKFRSNTQIRHLSAGKSKKVYIDLKAGDRLQSSDLEIGMKVDAGGLKKPRFKVLKVKTRPRISNRSLPIAH